MRKASTDGSDRLGGRRWSRTQSGRNGAGKGDHVSFLRSIENCGDLVANFLLDRQNGILGLGGRGFPEFERLPLEIFQGVQPLSMDVIGTSRQGGSLGHSDVELLQLDPDIFSRPTEFLCIFEKAPGPPCRRVTQKFDFPNERVGIIVPVDAVAEAAVEHFAQKGEDKGILNLYRSARFCQRNRGMRLERLLEAPDSIGDVPEMQKSLACR
jgi:hypothetical protein